MAAYLCWGGWFEEYGMMLSMKEGFLYFSIYGGCPFSRCLMNSDVQEVYLVIGFRFCCELHVGVEHVKVLLCVIDVCVAGVINYQNVIHILEICSDIVFIEKLHEVIKYISCDTVVFDYTPFSKFHTRNGDDTIPRIWRNLLPPSSGYKSYFPLSLKMEMPGSTKMLVPMCQTPPHHIP